MAASTLSLLLLLTLPINRIASLVMGTIMYLFTYMTLILLTGAPDMGELETIEQVLEKIQILESLAPPFLRYQQRNPNGKRGLINGSGREHL
jgi:hypothetical protein